jgi:ammonium transporter, Amt family
MSRFSSRQALCLIGVVLAILASMTLVFAQDTPPVPVPTGAPAAPAELKVDTGDTAWMLASTALVLFMTPGLALFYGGMVRAKNILNVLMQSFVAMSIVTVIWVVIGYSLAFAKGTPFLGGMDYAMLKDVGQKPFILNGTTLTVPHQVFMMFQMMFAIITPALISGAVVERMKFSGYVIFMALWSLIAYAPMAHMVWGEGGHLFNAGALDFAGGTVVHILSGISALTLAMILGKRQLGHGEDTRPHNLPMTLIGTGVLWFGWFGFNGGSGIVSNGLAGSAFMVTHIAAATAGLVWMLMEWIIIKKPTALGFASGAVAGLVAITPASGFVTASSALIIGALVSPISYGMIQLKNKLGKYDDTLDVFAVHCCGGIWGAIATGLFADGSVNSVVTAATAKGNGLLVAGGGSGLLMAQLQAILIAVVLGTVVTAAIAFLLKAAKLLRATTNEEEAGLDLAEHDETGYVQGGGAEQLSGIFGGSTSHMGGAPAGLNPEKAH